MSVTNSAKRTKWLSLRVGAQLACLPLLFLAISATAVDPLRLEVGVELRALSIEPMGALPAPSWVDFVPAAPALRSGPPPHFLRCGTDSRPVRTTVIMMLAPEGRFSPADAWNASPRTIDPIAARVAKVTRALVD